MSGSQRKQLIADRDERILAKIKQGRSVRAIAADEGYEADYTGKLCAKLATQYGVKYDPEGKREAHPNELPPGLSDRTGFFRRNAATKLYLWALKSKKHPLEVCREVGIAQAGQRAAKKTHGPFDWHLSHLDRWSETLGVSFEELILDLTFPPETAARMKTCLKKQD